MSSTLAAIRLNKALVLGAIKSGRRSCRIDTLDGGRPEPTEPHLAYRALALAHAARESAASNPAAFEAQVAGLKQVAELLRQQLDYMRRDRDAWRDEARLLALAE
jgi:hypothetical protein